MINQVNALMAQNDKFKMIKCSFPTSAKLYVYKTILELEEGDTVVVDTPSNGLQTAVVNSVHSLHDSDIAPQHNYKWIVQKVDTTEYSDLCEREGQARELINRSVARKLQTEMLAELEASVGVIALETLTKLTRL